MNVMTNLTTVKATGRIGSWMVKITKLPGYPRPDWLPAEGEELLNTLTCYIHSADTKTGEVEFFQKSDHCLGSTLDAMKSFFDKGRVVLSNGTFLEDAATLRGDYIGVFKVDPSQVRYEEDGVHWRLSMKDRLAHI
jgi:hypothetical protein